MTQDRTSKLKKIKDQVINFKSSPLYKHRIEKGFVPVIGEGNHQAKIMFIAEAPGYYEAKSGRHFQGSSGKIFDQLMEAVGLKRSEVYITNIVKDKLPNNRNPNKLEIDAYAPFLINQIKIIKPKIIATLGKFSTDYLFETCNLEKKPLKIIHGKPHKITCSYGECYILPLTHPAASLYKPDLLPTMKKDFQQIIKLSTNQASKSD